MEIYRFWRCEQLLLPCLWSGARAGHSPSREHVQRYWHTEVAPSVAAAYTGPVFVITGQHDAIYCTNPNPLPLPDVAFATFDCGGYKTGFLVQKELYPASSSFRWHEPVTAGHCWHLHYKAQATFAIAYAWMAQKGF
ncbi:hypothetical protein DM02DRAFT_620781 [Periconia macrospinosa]|uniref:Alpha/beta-hydrolase n=1 Tax=Periconia macrospinosa TaxID=97972 RepID=A0A2V1D100_9PLEO|nr:hypothetical protein DM02DRAFT_620781 [Periconia macrospinosa]